jgi:hypothetical protein
VRWTFSNATAYTKNISWTATGPNINNTQPWTLMARRERPGLLLDSKWETPLALFSAVAAHTWRRNVLPRWAEAHQSCVRVSLSRAASCLPAIFSIGWMCYCVRVGCCRASPSGRSWVQERQQAVAGRALATSRAI